MPTKTEILKVRMPADMMAQVKALATKEDIPVSQIIRKIIKEKLDEQPQKQPKHEGKKS